MFCCSHLKHGLAAGGLTRGQSDHHSLVDSKRGEGAGEWHEILFESVLLVQMTCEVGTALGWREKRCDGEHTQCAAAAHGH